MGTFYYLPETGQEVSLYTHLVVREDAHILYAFYEERERKLFRTLIKVNGVGPKLAITILSGMETEDFVRCVQNNDVQGLMKLPGVGKKTAERLLMEMRDRLKDWQMPVGVDAFSVGDELCITCPRRHLVGKCRAVAQAGCGLFLLKLGKSRLRLGIQCQRGLAKAQILDSIATGVFSVTCGLEAVAPFMLSVRHIIDRSLRHLVLPSHFGPGVAGTRREN